MNQEKPFVEEINEKESKNEKTNKIVAVVLATVLFGGTYYYYSNISATKSVEPSQIAETVLKPETIKVQVLKPNEEAGKKNWENKKQEKKLIAEANIGNNLFIQPTSKAELIRQAFKKAGKVDPFESTASPAFAKDSNIKLGSSLLSGNGILPLPPTIGGLPSIGGIPDLKNIMNGFNKYKNLNNEDYVEVKGFIGNKVIVSVNGITDALEVNESFQGLKVLKVDPINFVAKFEKGTEIISKQIKSLTSLPDKKSVELVKYNK